MMSVCRPHSDTMAHAVFNINFCLQIVPDNSHLAVENSLDSAYRRYRADRNTFGRDHVRAGIRVLLRALVQVWGIRNNSAISVLSEFFFSKMAEIFRLGKGGGVRCLIW